MELISKVNKYYFIVQMINDVAKNTKFLHAYTQWERKTREKDWHST